MIDSATITTAFVDLKREKKALDLALAALKKRQSPRTGFVHFFSAREAASDTIAVFENFCFTLALFRQKTAEAILEGKELIDRLLAFQAPNGNFPVYLHDYPRTWDPLLSLRIAPVLVQILRHFSHVLNGEIKQKIEKSLSLLLEFAKHLDLKPLWKHRYLRLRNEPSSFEPRTAEEWFETLISDQLLLNPSLALKIPYHKALQAFTGDFIPQEKGEPCPMPIEWLLAESETFGERLLKDHPHQIYAALVFPFVNQWLNQETAFAFTPQPLGGLRFLWGGSKLHSLMVPSGNPQGTHTVVFDLNDPFESGRHDVFEALLFADISSETELFIEEKKGTVFQLGERVLIDTPKLQIEAVFTLVEGEGDFCGQISRANRPSQIHKILDYEAFDWQIGLRTLRRNSPCKIRLELRLRTF